jgi:hypothetical protein
MRGYSHLENGPADDPKIFPASLLLVAFDQASLLQHLQMIDHRLGADVEPLGYLIEVKGAEGEQLKDASPVLISKDIQ